MTGQLTDDLEAAIWHAMHDRHVTTEEPQAFVNDILGLALAYAAGDSDEITRRRCQVLTRDGWRLP